MLIDHVLVGQLLSFFLLIFSPPFAASIIFLDVESPN